MASTNHYLFWAEFVVVVIICVSVLFCVWPAYWRTHSHAFIYLALGFMVVVFNSVADHTIALWHVPRGEYLAYVILRRLARLAALILVASGVISLTRQYFDKIVRRDDSAPNA